MEARAGEFAALMTAETGSTGPWGGFNATLGASILREAASMTTQITGEIIPSDKPGCLSLAMRQLAGVCVGIAPWNAPVILGTRAVAMPLACGNTALLKASELCPGTHRLIGQVLHEAGLPKGVVNVVTNAPVDAAAVVEALIVHPSVNMSTERIIVDEAVADAFVEKLAANAKCLPAGDPRGHVVLGSLVSRDAAEKVAALIEDAVARGARVIAGGGRQGTVMEATLLDGVTPAMRIYAEESFGLAKSIIRVNGVEEAIRVANDTEYGLSAAIFGRDVTRALAVAKRIETGICHINGRTVADEAQLPFGGVKGSGYGRFGGKAAIPEFTDLRWITIEGEQHYPF